MAPRFEYRQAEGIRDSFARHGVRHLFGKAGAILLGIPTPRRTPTFFSRRPKPTGARQSAH